MSLTDKIIKPRRTMVLCFVIDTSSSMAGSKIGSVNTAIQEVIPAIKEVANENTQAEIKIAALEFSSGARWITQNGPIEAEQFNWNFLDALVPSTDFGEACKELDKKLSSKAFLKEVTGSFAPAIFLLSDGMPNDDWEKPLAELWENNWFKVAIKVAVAIGDDADKTVLEKFTGKMERVIEVHNAKVLKQMIKFVSINVSKWGTKGGKVDDSSKAPDDEQKLQDFDNILQDYQEEIADSPDNDEKDW
jgi:uncharacterized protein YegL